jgi:hypothetical protein
MRDSPIRNPDADLGSGAYADHNFLSRRSVVSPVSVEYNVAG